MVCPLSSMYILYIQNRLITTVVMTLSDCAMAKFSAQVGKIRERTNCRFGLR